MITSPDYRLAADTIADLHTDPTLARPRVIAAHPTFTEDRHDYTYGLSRAHLRPAIPAGV